MALERGWLAGDPLLLGAGAEAQSGFVQSHEGAGRGETVSGLGLVSQASVLVSGFERVSGKC